MKSTQAKLERVVEILSAIMTEMEERAFQDERFSELSMRQVLYLNTIIRLEHPTFSDLAKELNVSKPSVTANVSSLIRKGYVQKVRDDEDLRTYHIILTQKGIDFDELHQNVHKLLAQQISSHLDQDETSQLTNLLYKIVENWK